MYFSYMYTLNGRRLCDVSKRRLCDSFLIPAMYRNVEKGGSVSKVSEMIAATGYAEGGHS